MNSSSYDNSNEDARRFNRMLWEGPTFCSKLWMGFFVYGVKLIARLTIIPFIVLLIWNLGDPTSIEEAIHRCAQLSIIANYLLLHIISAVVQPIIYIILV